MPSFIFYEAATRTRRTRNEISADELLEPKHRSSAVMSLNTLLELIVFIHTKHTLTHTRTYLCTREDLIRI